MILYIWLLVRQALDKVVHCVLISKWGGSESDFRMVRCIRNWLDNYTSIMIVNSFLLDWRVVSSGVLPGLIWGPVLFNVFILI